MKTKTFVILVLIFCAIIISLSGILYLWTSDLSHPCRYIDTTEVECKIDLINNTLIVTPTQNSINWDEYILKINNSSVDNVSLSWVNLSLLSEVSDNISEIGEATLFYDNENNWKPVLGYYYNVKIINIKENAVTYDCDVKA